MSGRIADIIIVPDDPATWYVAVGSGGVWKTEDYGTHWNNISDGFYDISLGKVSSELGFAPSFNQL